MKNMHGRIFGVEESYSSPEIVNSRVKPGTEETDFFSETGTYNRDSVPCIDFPVSDTFADGPAEIAEKLKAVRKSAGETEAGRHGMKGGSG